MFVSRWERLRFWVSLAACAAIVAGCAAWTRADSRREAPALAQTAQDGAAEPSLTRPASGKILRGFSRQSFDETLRCFGAHEAVDIAARANEPVLAALDGTVTAARRDRLLGGVAEVTSADGVVCRYAALKWPLTVSAGDEVTAGQPLGIVGSAPCEAALAPHVHFIMEKNDEPVEPQFAAGADSP